MGKPIFSFLVKFHDWFDPLAKPWAKWTYLGWMFAAIAFFNLGLRSAALSEGADGAGMASVGMAMFAIWFGTRFYWLYHTEILPKRAWSYHRRSGR
jgi:hypothetical protein